MMPFFAFPFTGSYFHFDLLHTDLLFVRRMYFSEVEFVQEQESRLRVSVGRDPRLSGHELSQVCCVVVVVVVVDAVVVVVVVDAVVVVVVLLTLTHPCNILRASTPSSSNSGQQEHPRKKY